MLFCLFGLVISGIAFWLLPPLELDSGTQARLRITEGGFDQPPLSMQESELIRNSLSQ